MPILTSLTMLATIEVRSAPPSHTVTQQFALSARTTDAQYSLGYVYVYVEHTAGL
jgi:hypothetical protein